MELYDIKANVAPKKRLEIYKNFKKYVQHKDTRSMDDICMSGTTEFQNKFQLQSQQKFLAEYMIAYPNWDKLLLYHQIGSGKTCTAITMAEEYLKTYPKNKINVVLPARLKSNFIDELISPCGFGKYISNEDFIKFNDSATSENAKKQIRARFMKAIEEKYNIMSFEKLKIIALKRRKDIFAWITEFTKDSMLIVDEVHNLISATYDDFTYNNIITTGKITIRPKAMNAVLFKLITTKAHPSVKMIFLTATPIFDNILQLKELVKIMTPEAVIQDNARIADIVKYLRGKVSYFPGTSMNAYPTTEYAVHDVIMSKTQDAITQKIQGDIFRCQEKDEYREAFMAKQRQVSLACLPDNQDVKGHIDEVLSRINEFAPKMKAMLRVLKSSPGKHVIYSSFVQTGTDVVEKLLRKHGWKDIKEVINNDKLWKKQKNKVFATWSGDTKDADKSLIKSIANNNNNINGNRLRVIIGSPSVKEGVSFKHIQHLHLLDPVWNQSAKTQIEGRAIRFCSHVDIDETINAPLRRNVIVDIYKLLPRRRMGLVIETCDQKIYDEIIPRKFKLIKAGETALKKLAIDNYLFRNLYADDRQASPVSLGNSRSSSINLLEEDNVFLKAKQHAMKGKCPKARRPDPWTKECYEGFHIKINNHGFRCCYKNKKVATKPIERNDKKDKKDSILIR